MTWRNILRKTILARGMRLKVDLGQWLHKDLDLWKWFYTPSKDSLIAITSTGIKSYNRKLPSAVHGIFLANGTPIHTLPDDLLKASVNKTRTQLLGLIDTGEFYEPIQTTSHQCYHSLIHHSHAAKQWCFEYSDIPQGYEPILQDIVHGNIWLISDGSYHLTQYGTAAWILEGITSNIQLVGRVIIPGQAADLSAYRCELARILAAITVINTLASYHKITCEITIQCHRSRKGFQSQTTSIK
jgi:hypothetical protein